jgi:hypothetical protein
MYLVTLDSKHELVHLVFAGHVHGDEARRCRAEIKALLPTLRPGFRLLTDLSGLETMDVSCADEIRAVMDGCRQYGVSQVIRVIPDPQKDIGFSLMSFFHYGEEVGVQTVESMADALKAIGS